jgi:hypothetical protein
MKPFYVYTRPFYSLFLNTVSEKYKIIFYSSLNTKLMVNLSELIQKEHNTVSIWISNYKSKNIKTIKKIFSKDRNETNVVIIDHDPKVNLPFKTNHR